MKTRIVSCTFLSILEWILHIFLYIVYNIVLEQTHFFLMMLATVTPTVSVIVCPIFLVKFFYYFHNFCDCALRIISLCDNKVIMVNIFTFDLLPLILFVGSCYVREHINGFTHIRTITTVSWISFSGSLSFILFTFVHISKFQNFWQCLRISI